MRKRAASVRLADPTFPPLLRAHPVSGRQGPFAAAVAAAALARASAGEVFWGSEADDFRIAVVLEPEVPARRALDMLFAAMVGFGDAFGAIAPPEVAVQYRWPATILVNGAAAGRARIALPDGVAAEHVPSWLVVGVEVAIRPRRRRKEPGATPGRTTLWDEGCGKLDRTQLIEAFSRHFLVWIDTWAEQGFRPIQQAWLARAEGLAQEIAIAWEGRQLTGRFLTLDEDGNLVLAGAGGARALPILPAAERPVPARVGR